MHKKKEKKEKKFHCQVSTWSYVTPKNKQLTKKRKKGKTLSEQKHLVLSQTRVGPTWFIASRVKSEDWILKCFYVQRMKWEVYSPPIPNPSSNKIRNICAISVGLFFFSICCSLYRSIRFCCCKKKENTWKEVGWQILVSQTLEASPSPLCKWEAKQRKEKRTDNKRRETAEDTIFPRVSAIPSPGSQIRYT